MQDAFGKHDQDADKRTTKSQDVTQPEIVRNHNVKPVDKMQHKDVDVKPRAINSINKW